MNILIENVDTLLYKNGKFTVKNTSVATKNDIICHVGEIPPDYKYERKISGKNRLLMPGLINCHTHAYMTVFRNYADDLKFDDWLFGRIIPVEDKMSSADGYAGTMLAACEMMKSGTTAFCDMHMFQNSVCEAVLDSGIRGVLTRGLSGGDDEGGRRRLNQATADIDRFAECDTLSFMIGPHSIYTCDDKLLMIAAEEAAKRNIGLNIHLSETEGEVNDCISKHGLTPVGYLEKLGFFDIPCVAAHCVYVNEEDADILLNRGVSVAHNPISNLKLANGIAPIPMLMKKGVNVCLGTDGCASNNALNMFREMSFAALLHKGISRDPQAVTANDVIKTATVNAAKAMGINSGEIAVGKKADLVLLDTDKSEFYPHNDLASSLCYSANGSEADTVIVNGNITVEGGKLVTADEEEIYYEIEKSAKRLGLYA